MTQGYRAQVKFGYDKINLYSNKSLSRHHPGACSMLISWPQACLTRMQTSSHLNAQSPLNFARKPKTRPTNHYAPRLSYILPVSTISGLTNDLAPLRLCNHPNTTLRRPRDRSLRNKSQSTRRDFSTSAIKQHPTYIGALNRYEKIILQSISCSLEISLISPF